MPSFLALYSGSSLSDPCLVAVSSDPEIVGEFAARLLHQPAQDSADPIRANLESGRRAALRLIHREATNAPDA